MAKWPYNTIAWQRLRAAKLATDPLCQYCPQGTVTPATQVDHRKAIKDSGAPFAWDRCSRHRGHWVAPGGSARSGKSTGSRCQTTE